MRILRVLTWLLALAVAAWGGLALWIAGPGPPRVRAALVVLVLSGTVVVRAVLRSPLRSAAVILVTLIALLAWWGTLTPSSDRDWAPDVARMPTAEIRGDELVIHNLRNFDYRSETDFDPRYEDRTYDLSKLVGLDLFVSHWGSPAIAHTIMSWEFSDGPPLAISIETRKTRGQEYSAIDGFFRQYALIYIVADERDLIRLRTNYRHEDVYLYRLTAPVANARILLMEYIQQINSLAKEPEFYNALTENCTTAIRTNVENAGGRVPWSWKLLLTGYVDEMLYERRRVRGSLPFARLKEASQIDERAKAVDQDPEFSRRIREGLPE
ncbi:MAG TPA: DUF4105 domain-containing protein [Myxococcota bacterium]|nr:DUF4105 domain-containing protein [Myxococcota bacterium]